MAQTTAWLPKARAAVVMSEGSRTAAELIETLSAPAATISRMPAMSRKPPPTQYGMWTSALARAAMATVVLRFSWLAVMSRKTTSSAPSRS